MALSGFKVVDLTRILAGPFCTQLLADLGADVVKIESPGGGDPVRQQGAAHNGFSWYFAQFNRNKRSLTLDLYQPEGREVLKRLLSQSDVLVENYRPGVLDKMGLDETTLKTLNPQLVVTHISGYGQQGPYRDRPSFDFIAQAMSGFMSINGAAGDPPLRSGQPISDLIAGLYAALGTLAALVARNRCGQGQHVESNLLSGLISMMAYLSAHYFATGELPERTGNDHPVVAPYGLFPATDGNVAIAPSNDEFVHRFLGTLDLLELLDDPRFADNQSRMANREALKAIISEKTAQASVEHWIETLNNAGVPCGRVQNLAEVFHDPQVLAQELVLDVDHGAAGTVRMTGFPLKLSETPCNIRKPAPQLGEHSQQVLLEVGYELTEIQRLCAAGVVSLDGQDQ